MVPGCMRGGERGGRLGLFPYRAEQVDRAQDNSLYVDLIMPAICMVFSISKIFPPQHAMYLLH